jgi:hypothetical protein
MTHYRPYSSSIRKYANITIETTVVGVNDPVGNNYYFLTDDQF